MLQRIKQWGEEVINRGGNWRGGDMERGRHGEGETWRGGEKERGREGEGERRRKGGREN